MIDANHLKTIRQRRSFGYNGGLLLRWAGVTLKPEAPDGVNVLEVRPKGQQPGVQAGMIELFINSKERPRIIVRVWGKIYLPSGGGQ